MSAYRQRTKEIRELEGITLPVDVGAISANSSIVLDFMETSPYDTYAPYNELDIFNDSTSNIKVYLNQRTDKYHPVAGKTEKVIDKINLYTLRIEEVSGADIAAGGIYIEVLRSGATSTTLAEKIQRRFGWLLG